MDLSAYSIIILLIAFVWSGFIRAGLGFGGAGLMYPIAFLAVDSVVFLVPIIAIQLLFFSSITLASGGYRNVDWLTVSKILLFMLPMLLVGVFGLMNFPDFWLLMVTYAFLILYSLGYIFNLKTKPSAWLNVPLLAFGSYISGLSLSGAPIVAAVALQYLKKEQARDSLFVIWFVAVTIKLATLYYYDVDLQLEHQLWLLPAAGVGHFLGLKMHKRLMQLDDSVFYRQMGIVLLSLSIIGLIRHLS